MNLKRCDKGHFYDADKFASCPHCAGGIGNSDETVAIQPDDDIKTEALTVDKVEKNIPVRPEPIRQESEKQMTGSLSANISRAMQEVLVSEPDDDAKTVRYYETETGIEPVVGWLVCIQGEDMGKSFNLKDGRNFIGRSAKMDVVLKDNSVSRDKHAVIVYEPKRREFLAQPGESRELFYLNDNLVLNFEKLKVNDVIQVGNTKLMFVPFCSEAFSWDDVKKEDKDQKN